MSCASDIIVERRARDVEVIGQRVRPLGGPGPPGRRRPSMVHDHERLALGVAPRRSRVLDDVLRQFLLTLWNVYGFFVTYANADGFDPSTESPPHASGPCWTVGRSPSRTDGPRRARRPAPATTPRRRAAHRGVRRRPVELVRATFAPRGSGTPAGRTGHDAAAAFHTLHECLVTTATLLAPFTPFVAEELWRNLAAGRGGPRSPFTWRTIRRRMMSLIDDELDAAMAAAAPDRRARSACARGDEVPDSAAARRGGACTARAAIGASAACFDLIADELNVKRMVFAESDEAFGRWRAKPNFKTLGSTAGRGREGGGGGARRGRRRCGELALAPAASP